MEFSGQYLTWEDYKALGGTLDLMPFNLLEFECRKKIDERTLNRLKDIDREDIPEEVRLCMFRLTDLVNSYASKSSSENKNITSENTDGYSVTYATGSQIQEIMKAKNNEIEDIIETDLFGVIVNSEHLLYLGVNY